MSREFYRQELHIYQGLIERAKDDGVKTGILLFPAFHAGNTGSNPVGDAK
jgi:hypothetical protein